VETPNFCALARTFSLQLLFALASLLLFSAVSSAALYMRLFDVDVKRE